MDNVRTLLSTMNKDELSTVTDEGTHLLTAAVSRNAHEIVELLLNAGAKVTGKILVLKAFQIRKNSSNPLP